MNVETILYNNGIHIIVVSSFKDPFSIFNISKGNISFSSDAPLELIQAASNELRE